MQRAAILLLQLSLWVAAVRAFVPFIPDDWCDPDEPCDHSNRRPGSARRRDVDRVLTLDLVARVASPNDGPISNAARARRAAARLARKYGRLEKPGSTLQHRDQPAKRQNTYSVSEPARPTAPNSAGIYQDGADFSYFVQMKIGSERKPFYMLLDTGAANTWVMGSDCTTEPCLKHSEFNPSESSSFQASGESFRIIYGTGEVEGQIGGDTVSLAEMTLDMNFGVANHTSADFRHFAFDGILGMATSPSVTGNFMRSMKDKKLVAANIFAVSLNRHSDGPNDGQVTFGAVDESRYTGEISYTAIPQPAVESGEWVIPLGGIGFGGKASGVTGKEAHIDTGTSFIFAPPADVEALFQLVPGATSNEDKSQWTVPCTTTDPVSITFSGVTYQISAEDWMVRDGDRCSSRIYGIDFKSGAWLLGDVFLKNVYSVFDADQFRIGFATKSKPATPSSLAPPSTSSSISTPSSGSEASASSPLSPSSSGETSTLPGFSGEGPAGTPQTATESASAPTQSSAGSPVKRGVMGSFLCMAAAMAMVA